MKTTLKIFGIVLIGVISFYYIKSENDERERRENSIRVQNEIENIWIKYRMDSADRERRNALRLAEIRSKLK